MIFFRADANQHIATGHIMRCISIAQRFKYHGHEVTFLIADNYPVSLLKKFGMDYHVLNSVWDNLDYETETIIDILKMYEKPLFIIDTYSVTRHYVESLIPFCKCCYLGSKHEYLGALYALINYSVSIDYGFYSSNYTRPTKMLLGPSFIPLREEFLRECEEIKSNKKCRVFLTTGGSNPNHYIEKILRQIVSDSIIKIIEVEVIAGRMFDDIEAIREGFEHFENIHIHENVKSMAEIMRFCDLAISANGSTVYELSACRVPVISFAMVKEQVNAAEKLSQMGLTEYCGEIYEDEETCIKRISEKLSQYVGSSQRRADLADKASSLIDGKGCERIYQSLI